MQRSCCVRLSAHAHCTAALLHLLFYSITPPHPHLTPHPLLLLLPVQRTVWPTV
jgi:hypothetical protein